MAKTRSARSDSPPSYTFRRGGEPVTLHKSPNLIAVRLRGNLQLDELPGRLLKDSVLSRALRFVTRYPGQQFGIFQCPPDKRDEIMIELDHRRKARQENATHDTAKENPPKERAEDWVLYCSHVYQRQLGETVLGTEIGLDNKIFVDFKKAPQPTEIRDIESEHKLRAIWQFPQKPGGVVFELTEEAERNPIVISKNLFDSGRYITAEPCLIDARRSRAVPGDQGFPYQWHLLNTGQGKGKPGADCNAPAAWDYTWGDPAVTVAVIDNGFDLEHPALIGKYRNPYDATGRDVNPRPEDFRENHGTCCAGLAVARRNGGFAVGIAPDCTLMPIRHAGRIGDFEEALAFYHAFVHKADVISCSWGPYDAYMKAFWPMPSITRYVIDLCVKKGRRGKGIPIFFAAGNGNEKLSLDGYANYKHVIAVGASTNMDEIAYYSDHGENVWVCAPSSGGTRDVLTIDRRGVAGYNIAGDYTAHFGGTSAAAPLVAGIAALMISVNSWLKVGEIKDILRKTAVKIGNNNPPAAGDPPSKASDKPVAATIQDYWGESYSTAYQAKPEYNNDLHSEAYGWGRVDAGAAVAEAFRRRYE